jgi:hypothetical protein
VSVIVPALVKLISAAPREMFMIASPNPSTEAPDVTLPVTFPAGTDGRSSVENGKTYARSRSIGGVGKVWSTVVVVPHVTVLLGEKVTAQSATAFCGFAIIIRANAPLVTAIPADTFDRRGLVRVRLNSFVVIGPRL